MRFAALAALNGRPAKKFGFAEFSWSKLMITSVGFAGDQSFRLVRIFVAALRILWGFYLFWSEELEILRISKFLRCGAKIYH